MKTSKISLDYSNIDDVDFSEIPYFVNHEIIKRPYTDSIVFEIPSDKITAFYEEYIYVNYDLEMLYEDFINLCVEE